jgi:glyoxylase-like metal-dependent hydrolase (beta-lactamase superfamily II)
MMLTRVADGVWVHESECVQSNSVVVQGDAGVLLIDAGLTEAELLSIADDLGRLGMPVVAGFSTHSHWDHVLWHAALGEAPRYGTSRCAADVRAYLSNPGWKDDVEEGLPPEIAGQVPLDLYGEIVGMPAGTERIPWDGPGIRVLEHEGHAPGHAALFIEEPGVLVAGDMLSDVLIPMPDLWGSAIDPVGDYLSGLQLLESVAGDAEFVIPGHGSVGGAGQAQARIDLDRAYLLAARDGLEVSDPRVSSPKPGWEWVADIHEGTLQRLSPAN